MGRLHFVAGALSAWAGDLARYKFASMIRYFNRRKLLGRGDFYCETLLKTLLPSTTVDVGNDHGLRFSTSFIRGKKKLQKIDKIA